MKDKRKLSILFVVLFVSQIAISASVSAEILYPVISNIHHTPINPSPEDTVTVLADVSHGMGLSEVKLNYLSESENEWNYINMVSDVECVFYGHITPYPVDSFITYQIVSTSINGFTRMSSNYTYTVYEYNVPTITNVKRDPSQPMYDELVNITAKVYDTLSISSVFLKYTLDQGSTTTVPMSFNSNDSLYFAQIPNTNINTSVNYWIEATNDETHTSSSKVFHYISLGYVPFLYEIWTDPFNATEGYPLTFFVSLFSRCVIVEGYIYYKINQGGTESLNLTQTDEIMWSSESILGDNLVGGYILEYWCQFNYSHDGSYHLYPSNPTHNFKTIVENNNPTIDSVNIYPISINKGDDVTINVTITDQSIIDVECIYLIPGKTDETHLVMNEITGTNIWTTTILTTDLLENASVVLTITVKDTNGMETIVYSGFFINDGSPPILYGVEDLREHQICHTYEHTFYVYVNDTSEIDYVKLKLWTENGSLFYGEYYMVKGGTHIYYYTLDNAPFETSLFTWMTYNFIACDIFGYTVESEEFTYYVYDYSGPIFSFNAVEEYDYHETPELHVIINDRGGTGVQSSSIVYSDDDWSTSYYLSLSYIDDNEYKVILPELLYESSREYYFTAIDFANNPSQSVIFEYTSVDASPPTIIDFKINNNQPVTNLDQELTVEIWLEDVNFITWVDIELLSEYNHAGTWWQKELYDSGDNVYFTRTFDYNLVGCDIIEYYFSVQDSLNQYDFSVHYQITVIDAILPTLSTTVVTQGTANVLTRNIVYWQEEVEPDVYVARNAYWFNESAEDLYFEVVADDETELDEVYFEYSYGTYGSWGEHYTFTQVGTSTTYDVTIDMTIFSAEKTNDGYSIIDVENGRFFFRIIAKDTSGNIRYWNPTEPFELWDGEAPTIINMQQSHTSLKGGQNIDFSITLNDNFKGIIDNFFPSGFAFIRFKHGASDTGWIVMQLSESSSFDYTWTTPNVDSTQTCYVWFKVGDLNALKTGWELSEQKDSWNNNQTYVDYCSFTIIDSTGPDISNWSYGGPAWTSTNPFVDYSQTLYVDVQLTDVSGVNSAKLYFSDTWTWVNFDNMVLISGDQFSGIWRGEISSSYLFSVYDFNDISDIHFKVVAIDSESNTYEELSPGWLDIRDFVSPVITSGPTCSHSQIYQGQTIRFDISAHDYGKGMSTFLLYAVRIRIDGGASVAMVLDNGDEWYYQYTVFRSIGVHNVQFYLYDEDLSMALDTPSNIYVTAYNILTYEVLDGIGPTIEDANDWTYEGSAWKNSKNLEAHVPTTSIDETWLLDLSYSLTITAEITDVSGIQYARLYYSSSRSTFSNYVPMSHTTGNNYQATISANILQSIYSDTAPESVNDIIYFKIYAVDSSSSQNYNNRETYDDDIFFEIWDYGGPTYSNYVTPSSASIGSQITIRVDVIDHIGVYNNYYNVKFVCDGTTYGWYSMSRISGDKFDGTYQYIWAVQNHHSKTCIITFQFKDIMGERVEWDPFLNLWATYDYRVNVLTTDSSQSFQIYDNTDPVISNHYVSPSDPEYNEQFRFYACATDSYTSISSVWAEWWVEGVKQTDISMSFDSGTTYKSALVGTYSYNTQIKYIIHAKDINNNEETTSLITFYIEDTVLPTVSNTYHTPNPIISGTNTLYVYTTFSDSGSGINTPQICYWIDGTLYGYYTMTHDTGGTYYYAIDISGVGFSEGIEYRTSCTDVAGNTKYSSIYGPYFFQDTTNPSISAITRTPTTVYSLDDVVVRASVTDTGSGVDCVRLYFKRLSTWQYVPMSIVSGKYQGTYFCGGTGHTDQYYVRTWDNAGNYAQSSTYSYVVQSGGGWPPWQPSVEGLTHSVDLSNQYDEGVLYLDKQQHIFSHPELIKHVIVEYKSIGEPSWHKVVPLENEEFYSAYIASATSLVLDYRVIIHMITNQIITSEIQSLELIDLTPPNIIVDYSPLNPEYDEIVQFNIQVRDSSGINETFCHYSFGDEWNTITFNSQILNEKEGVVYNYSHQLNQTVRFIFETRDNNGNVNQTHFYEFIVFSPIEDNPLDSNSQWIYGLYSIGGLFGVGGVATLLTIFIKRIWRKRK